MNKIQGAIEGIHYHVINGRAFPIVRAVTGRCRPVEEAERDARYLADCLREIHGRPPPAVPLSPTPPSAADRPHR